MEACRIHVQFLALVKKAVNEDFWQIGRGVLTYQSIISAKVPEPQTLHVQLQLAVKPRLPLNQPLTVSISCCQS
jgi:hypothetical protein